MISHSLEYVTAVLIHKTLINLLAYKACFSYAYNLHHPILSTSELNTIHMYSGITSGRVLNGELFIHKDSRS